MKVFIIGAGIGGLTAALALARTGIDVEVFEKASKLGEVGSGLQQSPNAMVVHHELGISKDIEEKSFFPEAGVLRDYRTGEPLLKTQMKDVYRERYGYKYLNIHRADLLNILITETKKYNISIHLGCFIKQVDERKSSVCLTVDGDVREADVLVGADGVRSYVRELIHGKSEPRFTGQVAWRGLVAAEKLPHGMIPFAANNWLGPDQHFVSYYVRRQSLINFVAVQERHNWVDESWNVPADIGELRNAFSGWDPRIKMLLDACETSFLWGLFDHAPLPFWSKGRVTLLGDAAHPMLPFMAQGASMAIEDAWVLAHCLSQHGDKVSSALKRYEAFRKPRATMVQSISRENAKLYHQSGLGALIRNAKLTAGSMFPAAVLAKLDKIYAVDVTRDFPIETRSRR